MQHNIQLPLSQEVTQSLHCGDNVYLSGVVYTARDAAHKRLLAMVEENAPLPFDIKNATIYYVGPTPPKPDTPIGSAGPTTSYRMDAYTPTLLRLGLRGMIGKGSRNQAVIKAMVETRSVYFGAIGGAGALLSACIKSSNVIAFPDLGPEAIHRLEVVNFPVTVIIDSYGASLYENGRKNYLQSKAASKP